MAAKKKHSDAPTIENRKARHDYRIEHTLEVGIMLTGPEVKAARAGRVSLAEGYVRATEEPVSLLLYSVHFEEYANARVIDHRPTRTRKLLAHKREIIKLARQSDSKGTTIVPLKMYFNDRGIAKLLIGVAQGKSHSDKRHDIRKREDQRDIQRAMSKRV